LYALFIEVAYAESAVVARFSDFHGVILPDDPRLMNYSLRKRDKTELSGSGCKAKSLKTPGFAGF